MGTWEDVRVNLKKRARKAKGDIDDSYLDKKFFRSTNGKVFPCKWCGKLMYIHDLQRSKRKLLLSCKTDDCIGNADMSEERRQAKLEKLGYGRKLGSDSIITKKKIRFNYFDEKGYV